MIYILIFFIAHWALSLFFHSAYLHRYASHKMYSMSPVTEKVFHFLTWFFQGSSFLPPRPYAVMHRMHHEYSDTEQDPHSPHFFKDVLHMMLHTRKIYKGFQSGDLTADSKFCQNLPTWNGMDKLGNNLLVRALWGLAYSAIYVLLILNFDLSWFWMALLPIHYFMGPIQGAIVNWCGHKYGYKNFDNGDNSKNSEVWGFALLGELFQNNHHKFPNSMNFAKKWYELDPTYIVLRAMSYLRIIKLLPQPATAHPPLRQVNNAKP